jgi:hypothetical protein
VGWDSTVGAWCRLENHCVLGEDVQVKVSPSDMLGWAWACRAEGWGAGSKWHVGVCLCLHTGRGHVQVSAS